eukprot:86731-Chlamydomonas_euryale.AAC.1
MAAAPAAVRARRRCGGFCSTRALRSRRPARRSTTLGRTRCWRSRCGGVDVCMGGASVEGGVQRKAYRN